MRLLHQHSEELQELRGITKELKPILEERRKEKNTETLKERHATAEKIRVLEAERDSLSAMREEIFKLEAKVKAVDADRLKALSELSKARSAYSGKDQSINSQIGRLRGELMESCDPKILQAETFFRDKLTWLRSPGRISVQRTGHIDKNPFTDIVHGKIESNHGAVNRAMVYCQQSLKRLESMKAQPECNVEMIEALKKGVPSIDDYSQSVEESIFPGSKVPNTMMGLLSDSELDWRKENLLERAKKVLKR